jgi:hypothetical protein
MARRAKNDVIDALCKQWGHIRRELLGLAEPKLAIEYIGAVKCTLGQRRDLHAGAKSDGKFEQHWPEVYTGEAFIVNQAFQRMRPHLKEVMELHYACRGPAEYKAEALYISLDKYWRDLSDVRAFVEGWLARADAA